MEYCYGSDVNRAIVVLLRMLSFFASGCSFRVEGYEKVSHLKIQKKQSKIVSWTGARLVLHKCRISQ